VNPPRGFTGQRRRYENRVSATRLLVSAVWFFGGYQYVVKGKRIVGLSWQFIGVLVMAAFCVNAILSRSWYSLIVVLGAIAVELLLIRRYWREKIGE
jgi:hypothetical protein